LVKGPLFSIFGKIHLPFLSPTPPSHSPQGKGVAIIKKEKVKKREERIKKI
jgi:hypothetical protein